MREWNGSCETPIVAQIARHTTMHSDLTDRRAFPRLRRRHPVSVRLRKGAEEERIDVALADDLSARGVSFGTSRGARLPVGTAVAVELAIPHLMGGVEETTLRLRAEGRVVRRVPRVRGGCNGEDGRSLADVAVHLDHPFALRHGGDPA